MRRDSIIKTHFEDGRVDKLATSPSGHFLPVIILSPDRQLSDQPPLAIVSAQGLLSIAMRHFGKSFSTIEA